jgi:hypothetical protein
MTLEFKVFVNQYPDNLSDEDFSTLLKTDLDFLNVTTLHSLEIEHLHGFWVLLVIYE